METSHHHVVDEAKHRPENAGSQQARMKAKGKIWLWVALAALLTAIVSYSCFLGGLSFECGDSILSEAVSPDGRYTATVFERNCGAVTSFTRIVSIHRRESCFDGEDENTWVFVTKDQPTINIRWSSQRQLDVTTEGYSRTPREQRLRIAHWENIDVVPANL
jgi:hypothetical protein